MISSDDFGEDIVVTEEIVNNIMEATINVSLLNVDLDVNSLKINLLAQENSIINKWCEEKEDLGIVVSYLPIDSSYFEFH